MNLFKKFLFISLLVFCIFTTVYADSDKLNIE